MTQPRPDPATATGLHHFHPWALWEILGSSLLQTVETQPRPYPEAMNDALEALGPFEREEARSGFNPEQCFPAPPDWGPLSREEARKAINVVVVDYNSRLCEEDTWPKPTDRKQQLDAIGKACLALRSALRSAGDPENPGTSDHALGYIMPSLGRLLPDSEGGNRARVDEFVGKLEEVASAAESEGVRLTAPAIPSLYSEERGHPKFWLANHCLTLLAQQGKAPEPGDISAARALVLAVHKLATSERIGEPSWVRDWIEKVFRRRASRRGLMEQLPELAGAFDGLGDGAPITRGMNPAIDAFLDFIEKSRQVDAAKPSTRGRASQA